MELRSPAQNIGDQTAMAPVKMLNYDEWHREVGGQCAEEQRDRVQPAGRRRDCNDIEGRLRRTALRCRAPPHHLGAHDDPV
jgi:hypothetical protein